MKNVENTANICLKLNIFNITMAKKLKKCHKNLQSYLSFTKDKSYCRIFCTSNQNQCPRQDPLYAWCWWYKRFCQVSVSECLLRTQILPIWKNKYAVTDGGGCDAQLRHNDGNKVLHALWKVMRLADQTDLGRSLFKQTNSAWFTHTMSPDATTEGNDLNKKGSSHDIKATCSLVLNEFWKKNCENFEKLLKWLP